MAANKDLSRPSEAVALLNQSDGHPKFEEELGLLEAIVTQIDSGELSLEEAIAAFERGVGLVRSLNQRLDDAEGRVELLMRGAGGSLRISPLENVNGINSEERTANGDSPPRQGAPLPKGGKEDEDIPF